MTNPFYYSGEYTYSGAFIPGTLARAEQLTNEFTSVQNAFTDFAYQGIDTGAANAYVVTTGGSPTGAYADGQLVQFKAIHASTGACTINVNGLGVVGLLRANGSASQAGDVTANTWFTAAYNSVFSAWTIITPVPVTGFTSTISGAAPTHLVGLTPAGGVALAAAPIDATYAIDQSISPTWTGTHTFSGTVNFNATVSFTGGQALTGAAGHYALILDGAATTGQSLGLEINAGTNASDMALLINNQTGGTQFFEISGTGAVVVGSPTGGAQGIGTINAVGLYINGVAVSTSSVSGANPTATIGLTAVNGSATTYLRSDGAPPLSQAITPTMTGAWVFTPSSAVTAVTVNAAVNASALALVGGTNTSNTYLMTLETGQGSGFSSGLLIDAGTNASDSALTVNNAAGTLMFQVLGNQTTTVYTIDSSAQYGLAVMAPSGSSKGTFFQIGIVGGADIGWIGHGSSVSGSGAITDFWIDVANGTGSVVLATGTSPVARLKVSQGAPYVSGYGPTAAALVDMTPDTGTFTITYTGFTTTVTATAAWCRNGNQVTLFFPAATGTSNSTSFAATGLPVGLASTRLMHLAVPFSAFENGNASTDGDSEIVISGTTITFWQAGSGTGWTNTNTKGVNVPFCVTYPLI